jgi:hypothetical protein
VKTSNKSSWTILALLVTFVAVLAFPGYQRFVETNNKIEQSACFNIYNDRPRDASGFLPYDEDAMNRARECFVKLNSVQQP